MKVYYLKGMLTNIEELNLLKNMFNDKEIEFQSLIDDYTELSGLSKEEIANYLMLKLPREENINLVAHSMGCNYALLLANRLDNISSITFVSPEFDTVYPEERNQIVPSNKVTINESSKMKWGLKKIKNILLFIKSKKWINEELYYFLKKKINTLIIYSKGDIFVSREILHQMGEYGNILLFEADTNSHNPLLEDTGAIDEIYSKITAQDLTKVFLERNKHEQNIL